MGEIDNILNQNNEFNKDILDNEIYNNKKNVIKNRINYLRTMKDTTEEIIEPPQIITPVIPTYFGIINIHQLLKLSYYYKNNIKINILILDNLIKLDKPNKGFDDINKYYEKIFSKLIGNDIECHSFNEYKGEFENKLRAETFPFLSTINFEKIKEIWEGFGRNPLQNITIRELTTFSYEFMLFFKWNEFSNEDIDIILIGPDRLPIYNLGIKYLKQKNEFPINPPLIHFYDEFPQIPFRYSINMPYSDIKKNIIESNITINEISDIIQKLDFGFNKEFSSLKNLKYQLEKEILNYNKNKNESNFFHIKEGFSNLLKKIQEIIRNKIDMLEEIETSIRLNYDQISKISKYKYDILKVLMKEKKPLYSGDILDKLKGKKQYEKVT